MSYSLTLDDKEVTKIETTSKSIVFDAVYQGVTYTSIGEKACSNNQYIESIDLSKTEVTKICNYAFGLCNKLATVVLPKKVQII